MHRTRLLLAVPAATALVFTGLAPASANVAGNHDNGDDASAEVLEIEDEAELRNGDDLLAVTFEYRCEDDGEDVEADVKAEDGDILYEENNVNLDCDDRRHDITVELNRDNGRADEDDRVDVTVTFTANGDRLARETEENVRVEDDNGRDDNDDRDRDHHRYDYNGNDHDYDRDDD